MDGEEPKVTWDDIDRALEHQTEDKYSPGLVFAKMDHPMKMVFYESLKEFKEHFMKDDSIDTGNDFFDAPPNPGVATSDPLPGPPRGKKTGGKWWIRNNKYGRFAK